MCSEDRAVVRGGGPWGLDDRCMTIASINGSQLWCSDRSCVVNGRGIAGSQDCSSTRWGEIWFSSM